MSKQRYQHLVFSVFSSRPPSLLGSIKAYVFFFVMFMLLQQIYVIRLDKKLMCPINFNATWFSWTILMVYPKEKLKSNCH
jgi:hypothetical protein